MPALPQAVVLLIPSRQSIGFTAEGDLVTAESSRDQATGIGQVIGPIAVFSGNDGRLVRQFGQRDDVVIASPANGRHIALRRGDTLFVLELESDRTCFTVPLSAGFVTAEFSLDDSRLALADKNTVSCFDTVSGERLWRREFRPEDVVEDQESVSRSAVVEVLVIQSPGRLLKVQVKVVEPGKSKTRSGGSQTQCFSTATGEPIRVAGDFYDIVEADAGRYAIVEAFPEPLPDTGWHGVEEQIVSLDDMRPLWKVPGESREAVFSPDGEQVWIVSEKNGRVFLTRRRSRDGGLLSEEPELAEGSPNAVVSPDSNWLIAELQHEGSYLPEMCVTSLKKLGIPWDGCLSPRGRHIVRTRANGSHPLVLVPQVAFPDSAFYTPSLEPVGHHPFVAVELHDRIEIFSFTPHRNWPWLAWAIVAPSALFVAIRRRRRNLPEPKK